jgi:putative SOS response-associated peptidase YedK
MAGVWEQWQGADGSEIISCAILTTAANSRMKAIHHRMPVLLFPDEYSLWLELEERKSPERLSLLTSREWEGMEAVPVSTYVNNASNEGSGCIAPVDWTDSVVLT